MNTLAASDGSVIDRFTELVASANGTILAMWTSGAVGSDGDILCARSTDGGTTWSAFSLVNSFGASDASLDTSPHLATDGSGLWVAVWQSHYNLGGMVGADGDILFSRSVDDGITWSDAQVLNSNAGIDEFNDLNPA